jgi:MFS superfamily sulfate permease-like transporter
MESIVLTLSFSFLKPIRQYLKPTNNHFCAFFVTLAVFVIFGFVEATICGFMTSLILFLRRMVNINNARVFTTKNHDVNISEFLNNKYGFSSNKSLRKELLDKIEVVQIHDILCINVIETAWKSFKTTGNIPKVILVYFRNIPFIDKEALLALERLVKNASKFKCIVIVSGTNGILLEAIKQKSEKGGASYGYIIPDSKDVVEKIRSKFK